MVPKSDGPDIARATDCVGDKDKRYPQNPTVLRAAAEIVRRKKAEAVEKEEYEDAARFHQKLQELEAQLAAAEAGGAGEPCASTSSSSSSSSSSAAARARARGSGTTPCTASASSSSSVPSVPAAVGVPSAKGKAVPSSSSSHVGDKSADGKESDGKDEEFQCVCGTMLDADTAFCLKCGTKVPEVKDRVPQCASKEVAKRKSRSLFSVPNPFHTVELLRSSGYSGFQAYGLLGLLYAAVFALEVGLLYAGWSLLSKSVDGMGNGDDDDIGMEAFDDVEF